MCRGRERSRRLRGAAAAAAVRQRRVYVKREGASGIVGARDILYRRAVYGSVCLGREIVFRRVEWLEAERVLERFFGKERERKVKVNPSRARREGYVWKRVDEGDECIGKRGMFGLARLMSRNIFLEIYTCIRIGYRGMCLG